MDYNSFLDWLTTEKGMSSRSAHDVVSRCKRILKMMCQDSIYSVSREQLLASEAFQNCSMFIKSQLKRTLILSQEYVSSQEEINEK